MRLTDLNPHVDSDTSTSSWPVYQFQHSRKCSSLKDCLIIIAVEIQMSTVFPINRKFTITRLGPPKTVPAA